MAELISTTKGIDDKSFDTYVPELSDNANIQNAFELFYYGDSTVGNTTNPKSIHEHLLGFDTRITSTDAAITGHAPATFNVHGITGSFVGTTDTQTLSNKTLSSPIITGTISGTGVVTSTNIVDGTVTGTDIANGTITSNNIADATIMNADISASAAIADTKLAIISTAGKVANSATTATNLNTASAIVARDASGNFTAGTITATLNGNLTGAVVTSTNIVDGTIMNADISASAAIVATKLTGTTADFNTALSDGDFATIAGTQTLLNKTLTSASISSPIINSGAALTVTSTDLNTVTLKPTLSYQGTIANRNIFVQTTQPTAINIGDIWIDF